LVAAAATPCKETVEGLLRRSAHLASTPHD
jgi:hypothetical protein